MLHLTEKPPGDPEKAFPSSPTLSISTRYRSVHRRVLRILTPSFLSQDPTSARDVKRPTDFLDGMRGYAAFAVYCCHWIMPHHPRAHNGWSGHKEDWFTQLPILRLIYSGHVMVSLFFVISGFSISLKALKLARTKSYSAFADTMVSALFRRTLRLYLPCLAMLAITFILACCGAFDFMFALTKNWPFLSSPLKVPAVQKTFFLQLADFASQVWDWADPFGTRNQHIPYGVQLWTIPVELRCSFVTFLTLVGLAKTRPAIRIGMMTALCLYFTSRRHPEPTQFLCGTILAELYLIRQERAVAAPSLKEETQSQKMQSSLLFVFGLYVASYPPRRAEHATFTKPLVYIASFVFPDPGQNLYVYTSIAGTLLVWVVSRSPFLQSWFATPVGRYLGKISFGFYLVHQCLINWFGYRSILSFWSFTGHDTLLQYELGLAITWLFQTAATIWAGDLFWRYVDAPTVGFTKWVEDTCREI